MVNEGIVKKKKMTIAIKYFLSVWIEIPKHLGLLKNNVVFLGALPQELIDSGNLNTRFNAWSKYNLN